MESNAMNVSTNNAKYFDAILGLAMELRKHNIPFSIRNVYEGYQIVGYIPTTDVVGDEINIALKEYAWDVAIHDGTYGSNRGLLEGCGIPFTTEYDDVIGDLTVECALDLILKYYNK